MADLILMPDVEAELDALYESEPETVDLIDVLFDALANNKEVLDVLCKPMYRYNFQPPFEIKRFQEVWHRGYNIYTLRVYDASGTLLNRRVLIGHDAQRDTYFPLAFPERDHAYDTTDRLFAGVIRRYDEAGIPVYR